MQLWRAPRGQCLLCAFHPLVRPAVVVRNFTTSPPWERSKSKSKKEVLSRVKKKANIADHGSDGLDSRSSRSLPNGKSAAQAQAQKSRRKTTKQYERFAALVVATAHDVKFKYKKKAKLAPVWTEFMRILLKAVENPRPPKNDAEEFEEFEEASEVENAEEGSESETAAGQAYEVEADPPEDLAETTYARSLKSTLEEAFIEGGQTELTKKLEEEFRSYAYDREFSMDGEQQKKIADLCNTIEWYPGARSLHRTIHLHVGPTNSGKTYHALKRLETAKNGFYAGPLRLLAHEVYSRFTQKGIPCALVTGDEIKIPDNQIPRIFSNTVEMAPLSEEVEVGVIDEIQMIGDPNRGWAWTKAVLGAQVRELHLCGEERVVPLIRTLAALTGDKIKIHRYQRLNPLKAMSTSLKGNLKNLQKGDCVVAFSRLAIHGLKRDIERATGRRAAIVYGSLPAEIRTQQASLFNDPDNDYDFLVASDAIGMGLNLSCKRIIFESVVKRLPSGLTRLTVSEIKQIGGRAGRYRVANQKSGTEQKKETNIGFVTSLESVDLPFIQQALASEPEPIHAACLIPSDHIIEQFAAHFPLGTPFSYIVQRLSSMVEVDPNFFLADTSSLWKALAIIDDISLTVEDRILFMHAPIDGRNVQVQKVAKAFARCIAQNKSGDLIEIPEIPFDVLDRPVSGDKEYLSSLETLHRALLLYLWLSFRAGGVFTNRELATHVKELVEVKMDRALTEFSANRQLQKATSLRRQFALLKQQMQRSLHADEDTDAEALDVNSFEQNLGPLDGELNDAPEAATRTA
ncbi:hypothetical protein FQN50_005918 [Emmonsiellopsis sp. PD_5]|nr:hypothetical protein FQN50_005918 [Emmonsiellopsis sp. PD_5]